jgi:hypothetical protein
MQGCIQYGLTNAVKMVATKVLMSPQKRNGAELPSEARLGEGGEGIVEGNSPSREEILDRGDDWGTLSTILVEMD